MPRKSILGGVVGAAMNLPILSVYNDMLYIHRVAIDNSYNEQLVAYEFSKVKIIRTKAGIFGGDLIFEYEEEKEHYSLPSKAEKFAMFFVNK